MNVFDSIRVQAPKSNGFDLTHDVKMSTKFGQLTPCCVIDCVPGDRFKIGAETLIRFAPLIAPVMHRMDVSIHYFFVANRLLWADWENFISPGQTPIPLVFPYVIAGDTLTQPGTLADYLGVPVIPSSVVDDVQVSALPFAAYNKIYNDYYRDQNLVEMRLQSVTAGENPMDEFTLLNRSFEHDYFTSSLPFAQKGAAVEMPSFAFQDIPVKFNIAPGTGATNNVISATHNGAADDILVQRELSENTDLDTTLFADTSELTGNAPTINDLRRAEKLQQWLELNARAGTRYVETIAAHFDVKSSDARLQRAEYITGVKSPVIISEVLNTTGEDAGLPQGNMAGHGISTVSGKMGSYFCEEHGYIIGIMSVMPKPAYYQGIPKHFFKFDRLDFYWPLFAHLGEQQVLNKEIYVDDDTAIQNTTFGYVPRYSEYKFMVSRVAGDFKSSLNFWHMSRDFGSQPNLSQEFIEVNPTDTSLTRIFAVQDGSDYLFCHILNRIMAIRKMPKFGTPSL